MRSRILSGLVVALLCGSCSRGGPEAGQASLEKKAEQYEARLVNEVEDREIDPFLTGSYWLNEDALGGALEGNTLDLQALAQERKVMLYFQQMWCTVRLRGAFSAMEQVYREERDLLPIVVYPERNTVTEGTYSEVTDPTLLQALYDRHGVEVPAVIAGSLWREHGDGDLPQKYFVSFVPARAQATLANEQLGILERMRDLTGEDHVNRISGRYPPDSAAEVRRRELSCPDIFVNPK